MKYVSTRGQGGELGFQAAFAAGLAPDGGLYVPTQLPDIAPYLDEWAGKSYPELASEFLGLFNTDHGGDEILDLVMDSYASFGRDDCAPLHQLDDNLWVQELFHGPTLAFKDFGLQLLGALFEDQIQRTSEPINVLGATSGDTGAAAISGLANRDGVRVFILYPEGRISALQERQMTCTGAENIYPIPIKGSFDDAQRIIKSLFGDLEFKAKLRLSAVNSINLARILAQSVYYVSTYLQLPEAVRAQAEYVVPTGNFGNVFAGWLAHQSGLPVGGFQIATNQNDILYRLFTSGRYEPGAVNPSVAPSMDIQVASNFERFLYYHGGQDGVETAHLMKQLNTGDGLELPNFDAGAFRASRMDDGGICETIKQVHEKYDYVVDPHTACGFNQIDPARPTVVLSTAHPAKFPDTIEDAIGKRVTHPTLEALVEKEQVRFPCDPTDDAVRALLEAHALT